MTISRRYGIINFVHLKDNILRGGVSERFKEAVLKTVELLRVPWVRIPPLPPTKKQGEMAEWSKAVSC